MIKASCTCSKPNDSLSRRLPLLWMPLSAVLASFFGIGLSVFDPAECAADRDDVFEDATASFDSSDGGLVGTLNDVRAAAKDSEYGNRGILKAPPSSVAPPIGGLTAISSIRQGVLPLDFISRRGPPKNFTQLSPPPLPEPSEPSPPPPRRLRACKRVSPRTIDTSAWESTAKAPIEKWQRIET
jgi:hypothetical protein